MRLPDIVIGLIVATVLSTQLGPVKERVTVAVVMEAYQQNALAADAKYKSAVIEVSGLVERVDSVLGSPFVVIVTKLDDFSGVHALFDRDKKTELATLKRGDKIVVKGTCTGQTLGSVVIKSTVIIK